MMPIKLSKNEILGIILVPAGIAALAFVSNFLFPIPNKPGVLIALVVFSGLLGGLWIGLFAAIVQICFTLWFVNGVEVAAGAAPFIQFGGLSLSEPEFQRFAVFVITAPAVAIAAGLSRWRNNALQTDVANEKSFADLIFANSAIGIAYGDIGGRITRCNEAFASIVGRRPQELIGKSPGDLIDERDRESEIAKAKQLWADKIPQFTSVSRYRKPDGSSVWVRKIATLARNAGGAPSNVILFARDVSAETEQAELLSRSEQRYKELWEYSHAGNFLQFSPDWRIQNANHTAIEMFGSRDNQHLSSFDVSNVSPEKQPDGLLSRPKWKRMVASVMLNRSEEFEWLFRSLDGRDIYCSVMMSRLDENGKEGVQVSLRDVTDSVALSKVQKEERIRLAEEVQARTSELEDALSELNLAQLVGQTGSFSVDLTNGLFSCSPQTARMFNLEKFDEFPIGEWLSKVHPDDRALVQQTWEKAIAAGTQYELTYRIVVKEGIRYIKAAAMFKKGSNGNTVSAVGSLADVTGLMVH